MAFGGLGLVFGRLGASSRSGIPVPVLSITSTGSDTTPDFRMNTGSATLIAGDTIRVQIQLTGGDWASLYMDDTHTVSSGEASGHSIDFAESALPSGTYDARAMYHHNSDSAWSNTVTFPINSAVATYYILGF